MENLENLNDYIEICDHCGDSVITCECIKPIEAFNQMAYENARRHWMHSMNEYNGLNWFKKIFIQKPKEPKPEDFV